MGRDTGSVGSRESSASTVDNSETPESSDTPDQDPERRRTRYAYMRSDGTIDIVLGSLVAGLGGYAYQFIGGRSLGEEGFAPIGILLTAHFLAFVIVLMPIEQFVIRRLTIGARGWVVPGRAIALVVSAAAAATIVVLFAGDDYFTSRREFVMFMLLTVLVHFFFAVGRGYLAGFRRFRAYGYVSAAASLVRVAIAVVVAIVAPSVTGFAWAHILGPLVIFLWRPWRPAGSGSRLSEEEAADSSEKGLLAGLVLSAAASQALLLAGPLVASRLGATAAEFSVTYATLLIARAPLTLGYNLIARILPPFTEMAVRGERRELRAWARGIAIAAVILSFVGALLGALLGPVLVSVAFGEGFAPDPTVAAIAGAGVVIAAGGLFIGQILVARGQSVRLAIAWLVAVIAAVVMVAIPFGDPIYHVVIAFLVGEVVALTALVTAALLHDPDELRTSHGYVVVKRSIDIAGSMVALILLLPVLLVAAIAVRIDSPGPAFFRQQRVGRDGRDFWMVKIRTMVIDHDEEVFRDHLARLERAATDDDYTIRIDEDPRITKVGSRLRRWSIDELPNLWNVLKGSMTLVGPRPLVRDEAELIGLENPRFTVKPGVTGMAQVHGRDSIGLAERTEWDERYVEERSTKLDLEILLATVTTVFSSPGASDGSE
jgi:lipopolysaccharide/colanic/teichoic acid biosynthesis glycosyltransferase